MDLKAIGCGNVDWFYEDQDRDCSKLSSGIYCHVK
jgi:hypothetical protein